MKRGLFLTAIAVLGALGQVVPAATLSPAARDVNATFDRYVQGWKDGDLKTLGGIYANDADITAYWPDPSKGGRLEGWTRIRAELKDVFDRIHGMDLDFDERQIDVYETCAVLTTQWTWHHPADPIFAHGRGTFVFNKRGGKWILVHEHSSVMPFIPGEDPPQPTPAGPSEAHN